MTDTADPYDQGELEVEEIEKQFADTTEQILELGKRVKHYQSQALLAKENGNPELLSNTLIRLARVNSALGSKAAFAKYIARNADRAYRRLREQKKLNAINEKNAIGKADSMAYIDKEVDRVYKIWSEVQLLADTTDDMSYRTDTFLKMSQSGLSLIKQDINGGRP